MLYFSLISCISYLAHAAAIYDQAQQPLNSHAQQPAAIQEPLGESSIVRIFALIFNNIDKYILPSIDREGEHPTLGALQDHSTYRAPDFPYSVITHVPSGAPGDQSGAVVVIVQGAASASQKWDSTRGDFSWIDFDGRQADHIALSSVGVRNGGMVAKSAYHARVALDTPFISIPDDIFGIVLQATRASWDPDKQSDRLVVDCHSAATFPDLVFGLDTQADEIVVTPEQYVVREGEKCVLLVRRVEAESNDEIVLGWAAIRGREFVLDWVAGKMGFESPMPCDHEDELESKIG